MSFTDKIEKKVEETPKSELNDNNKSINRRESISTFTNYNINVKNQNNPEFLFFENLKNLIEKSYYNSIIKLLSLYIEVN